MTQLACTLSDALITLIESGNTPFEAVEIGPWFSLARTHIYRRKLSRFPFHFHASNQVALVGLVPGTLKRFRAYVEATQCPWVSVHLSTYPPGSFWFYKRFGFVLPPLDPDRVLKRLQYQVGKISRVTGRAVILENLPILPDLKHTPEIDPDFITRAISTLDCGMLLDTAHALVAAAALGQDPQTYIQRLPLDRVVQLHTSGPGIDGDRLVDAHNPLQESDYKLLEWLLGEIQPHTLTLEYFRESSELPVQLDRLRQLL
jgi:uncharacterized protein (UPF0276 family)